MMPALLHLVKDLQDILQKLVRIARHPARFCRKLLNCDTSVVGIHSFLHQERSLLSKEHSINITTSDINIYL